MAPTYARRAFSRIKQTNDGPATLHNDAVIVCAGGLLPTPLRQKAGITFATKFGTA